MANFVRENFYAAVRRDNSEGLAGQRLSLNLLDRVTLEQQFNFYQNVRRLARFRFDMASTLSARVTSRLSFTTGVVDRYLSEPPIIGGKKNELVVTTGLGIRF